jgi:hypothetical protein
MIQIHRLSSIYPLIKVRSKDSEDEQERHTAHGQHHSAQLPRLETDLRTRPN